MVQSSFIGTTELNGVIAASIRDLWAVLVRTFGDKSFAKSEWINAGPSVNNAEGSTDQSVAWPKLGSSLLPTSYGGFVLSSQLTADGGTVSKYTLPDDFERLVRVHFAHGRVEKTAIVTSSAGEQYGPEWRLVTSQSNERMVPMRPLDIAATRISMLPTRWQQGSVRYRLHHGPHRIVFGTTDTNGNAIGSPSRWMQNWAIDFLPVPLEDCAVQLFYVPKAPMPLNDTDECDLGYPDWIIHDGAAYCLEKQRSDSSVQRALMERIRRQIEAEHQTDDAANPPVVSVVGETDVPEDLIPW